MAATRPLALQYDDDDDGIPAHLEPGIPQSEAVYPAYVMFPQPGPPTPYGLSCAAAKEYCFWCVFRNGSVPNDDGTADCRSQLATYAKELLAKGCEPRVVAESVAHNYATEIQPNLAFVDGKEIVGVDDQIAKCPDWSIESVQRHLLHADEFKEIFHSYLERTHSSIVMATSQRLLTATGDVCPIAYKAFSAASDSYMQFMSKKSKTALSTARTAQLLRLMDH